MGSREDNSTPRQPLLSSLVVRSTDNGGGGGGGGTGSDYEPGEVRGDPPPYLRSDRYDNHAVNITWCKNLGLKEGYRGRAGSASPVRRRDERQRFSPGFEHSGRGFGRGRDLPRHHRYQSPPYGRERFAGKGYDRPGHHDRGPLRVEGLPRNNPNVQQREGDWFCPDPSCKNLNFARRDHCNNCNRPRPPPGGSPRMGYPNPHFPPRQRFPSPPPLIHSPGRIMNGSSYNRSPPRIWSRDAPPRDLRSSGPLPPRRNNGRFSSPPLRGERPDYPQDEPRDRYNNRHDRPMPLDWPHRDRRRDGRVGYGRRVMSPPPLAPELPPPRGWAPPIRERSRSPIRGGVRPRDYPRDPYMNRGRGERRVGRGAF